MSPSTEIRQFLRQQQTRRVFLGRASQGLGALALGSILQPRLLQAAATRAVQGAVNPLHFPAKARRVIWLSMAGGPSHLETFDPKPKLAAMHGQPMPESFTKGHRQQWTLVRVTEVLASGAASTGVAAATGTAAARRVAHNSAAKE